MFHRQACSSADDTLAELVDYCYRQFAWLLETMEKNPHFMAPKDAMEEFKNHDRKTEIEN
jgi:hypothetical protein